MDELEAGLVRAMCFHEAWDYAPTPAELMMSWDRGSGTTIPSIGPLVEALARLKANGVFMERRGRIVFHGQESLIEEHEKRESWFPRKWRHAQRVTHWLRRLAGVRFVALCNTTALSHARDSGDLDFFVVTRQGTVWQTRGWATLPFKLLGQRPNALREVRDAVCLSFFVDDAALNLTPLQLRDDVYFRHWFLSLLPLYDDGIAADLWKANAPLLQRHPFAQPWTALATGGPSWRIPFFSGLEAGAKRLQTRAFSPTITALMNKDTRVVVNDHVLKFHTDDGRERYREAYQKKCERYGVAF